MKQQEEQGLKEAAIFRWTTSGLDEIQRKTHELTQSERLVLIVIDGQTSYVGLREKLKGLAEERFNRALHNLLQKSLIVEVSAPAVDRQADNLKPEVVDLFLQQDPLDPITVTPIEEQNGSGAGGAEVNRLAATAAWPSVARLQLPVLEGEGSGAQAGQVNDGWFHRTMFAGILLIVLAIVWLAVS